jgi:hypothetical protein
MGMRFGKRISIAKGLKLNVSRGGLGLSLGGKGGSISTGPRGPHLNVGIAGTGVSFRTPLSGPSPGKSSYSKGSSTETAVVMNISIDENTGKETLVLETTDGRVLNNETLIRKAKKTDQYKAKVEELREKVLEEVSRKTEVLLNIVKETEPVLDLDDFQKALSDLKLEVYKEKPFPVQKPAAKQFIGEVTAEAKRTVKSWKFWELKSLRNEFIDTRIEAVLKAATAKWEDDLAAHNKKEADFAKDANKNFQENFNYYTDNFKKAIKGDTDYIAEQLEAALSGIQLPVEFSISFKVVPGQVELDLDLPEIENFPSTKASILQSGKVSIKEKTISEKQKDYCYCVTGLAFYFASVAFNISPAVEKVIVSGFTQRPDKTTSQVTNQYVYCVPFSRWERFSYSGLDLNTIDPVNTIRSFGGIIDVNSKYELKEISLPGQA